MRPFLLVTNTFTDRKQICVKYLQIYEFLLVLNEEKWNNKSRKKKTFI